MKRSIAAWAVALCAAGAIAAPGGDGLDSGGITNALRPMRLPSAVQRVPDIAYGDDPRQRFDVYLPPHPEHAPLIVMVHGGAWMIGNKAMPQVADNKATRGVTHGATPVSLISRLVPQTDDVARALPACNGSRRRGACSSNTAT